MTKHLTMTLLIKTTKKKNELLHQKLCSEMSFLVQLQKIWTSPNHFGPAKGEGSINGK